jgi:ABC-type multidrug transport system ATPase subunit
MGVLPNHALNAIVAGHGQKLKQKITDYFIEVSNRDSIRQGADNFLPPIKSVREIPLIGGSCEFGPQFGPWGIESIINLTMRLPSNAPPTPKEEEFIVALRRLTSIPDGSALSAPTMYVSESSTPSPTASAGMDMAGLLNKWIGSGLGPVQITVPCTLGMSGSFGQITELLLLMPTVGDAYFRLGLIAILFPLIAICLEDISQSPRFSRWSANKTPCPPEMLKLEDENVKAEKERVAQLDPRRQIMYVNGLRKVYGNTILQRLGLGGSPTHAVRGVTWASDTGMVLGLLGVNGAGKTTSFKMMSGILTPSEGSVRILGIDIMEETSRARRLIGYCPQFDALVEKMTVVEHLSLYGRMKGLTGDDLQMAIQDKLREMSLLEYRDRAAGSCSGGNKRKLSVGMAVIGEPPVIFLDEPSTGMDPFARRFMWSAIRDLAEKRKQSVVVLTTHSMDEAEALCSTIAIQVDGQLRCLGSAQQLKSQYGHGYEVLVKFDHPSDAVARQFCTETFHVEPDVPLGFAALAAFDQTTQSAVVGLSGPLPQGVGMVPAHVLATFCITQNKMKKLAAALFEGFGALTLLEAHGPMARWRLTEAGEEQIASLLQMLNEGKVTFELSDFSVCQSSLEQIFNGFAAEQESKSATTGQL